MRSDWGETSTNGEDEFHSPINRSNSIGIPDEEEIRHRLEADQHVASYVSDQLERIRSQGSASVNPDEFETMLDGQRDGEANSNGKKEESGDYFNGKH
jgi:hypothetical protein